MMEIDNQSKLEIFNTLTKKKEHFVPLNPGHVGLYVCGPTVYGEPHLGHARPAVTFDLVFRYLQHIGYKVRYVRNITDVGHLEHDADSGEDKIAKKARLEQLEPMEVAQFYIDSYHRAMDALNVKRPSIEPRASGHIMEQIDMVQRILDAGFAYLSEGSVYFDVAKFDKEFGYGKLSGRKLDELLANTRTLDGQEEKHNPADFALWKKAAPEHIMRWRSPWSNGFPGWHIECTAMSTKYLGEQFDIHGGGMDLLFPHHESEVCQSTVANGMASVKYWMHNNMITINGQKMGKSLGNFITLEQFFTGNHSLLSKAYSPMTIRFFILSAHYRSTVDFSDEALQASEKGLERLMNAISDLDRVPVSDKCDAQTEQFVKALRQRLYDDMNDDLQSQMVISHLFEACRVVNTLLDHKAQICKDCLEELASTMRLFTIDLLGLKPANAQGGGSEAREEAFGKVVDMVLDLRAKAKAAKDWATSDQIRDELAAAGFEVKDTKDGVTWKLNK